VVESAQSGKAELDASLAAAAVELGPLRKDYIAVVDPQAFVPLERLPPRSALLAVGAAYCGSTRLIDNMEMHTP
jgi:pantothenate synthetase